jgi:hypothetical protein
MQTAICRALTVWALLGGLGPAAFGASHYVRPGATGNGSGNDWGNAYPNLPATLVRGDTYYLAGGTYGKYTFDDAPNGTKTISILRATDDDHGTNTGWQSGYATGMALFSHWDIFTDYYVIDGRQRNSDWYRGQISAYGIRVQGTSPVRLDNGFGQGSNNLTFRYIDFIGGGRDTGANDDVIYGLTGNSNLTFQYCALHDSDRTIFLMRGNWQNLVIDHSFIARNTSTPAVHGELMSMTDSSNVTISNNVLEDIEGTAFFAGVNGGTMTNWKIFGNVAQHTAAYISGKGRKPGHDNGVSGFVFIGIGQGYYGVGNNFQVYNNTFYDVQGLWSGVVIQMGSGNDVRNNIWYASVRTNNSYSGTISYNWYYNTIQDGDTSSTKVVCTKNCDIFVNPNGNDFHLKKSLTAGYKLTAPVTVDTDGVTRGINGTWDRGAYQFAGTTLSPGRPQGLVAN